MKRKMILIVLSVTLCFQCFSQQVLGDFSAAEAFEWPRVVWYRDLANNWDEGIIKTAANTSGITRSGYGIHFHQVRQFTFWSSGFDPLLSIDGGSGKTYIKGNLGIGVLNPQEKLSVNGKIRSHEVKVEVTGWPDYVFKPDYRLNSLSEVEKFIKENGHLPDVPSAIIVETEGLELGEMNKLLLKKVEELTLHLIEQNQKNKQQDLKIEKLMDELKIRHKTFNAKD